VADEDDVAFLRVEDLPGRGQIGRQRAGGVLHDRDVVTTLRQQVEDALPAGAVDEAAVHQDHVLDRTGTPFGLIRMHINVSAVLGTPATEPAPRTSSKLPQRTALEMLRHVESC